MTGVERQPAPVALPLHATTRPHNGAAPTRIRGGTANQEITR